MNVIIDKTTVAIDFIDYCRDNALFIEITNRPDGNFLAKLKNIWEFRIADYDGPTMTKDFVVAGATKEEVIGRLAMDCSGKPFSHQYIRADWGIFSRKGKESGYFPIFKYNA